MKTRNVMSVKLCLTCPFLGEIPEIIGECREIAYTGNLILVYDTVDAVQCRRKDCDNWKEAPEQEGETNDATPND